MGDDRSEAEYATIFARHHARLLRVAELIAGEREVAADAVAEAFARTYPHWRRGRVDDVGAYLRRAVVHEIHRTWRKRHVSLDDARYVDGAAEGIVERDRVWRALEGLSSRQRTVVVLRYYDDLREGDIADAMGVPVGTVKSNLSRALEKLRPALADVGGADQTNTVGGADETNTVGGADETNTVGGADETSTVGGADENSTGVEHG